MNIVSLLCLIIIRWIKISITSEDGYILVFGKSSSV